MNAHRLLVVDLECTCSNDAALPRGEMEIIEVGAVWVEPDGTPIAEFQTFVRPRLHPVLTAFCRELTSIRQHDVDTAPSFYDAMLAFARFIGKHRTPTAKWGSWGVFDAKQFDLDFARLGTKSVLDLPYINIKQAFAKSRGLKRPCSMAEALDQMGLTLEGTHHRGIDDARNIARLARFVL